MKKAAYKSYISKGQAIVDLNYAAIDAGGGAVVKVRVPEDWKYSAPELPKAPFESERDDLAEYVNSISRVVNSMAGDSLPVSVFKDHADGTFPLGASADDNAAWP